MAITISLWQSCLHRSAASAWGVIVVTLILPQRSSAADWTFVPTLRLRESYSDNIRLATPEFATSDLVSEVSPGITVTGNSSRLKMTMAYAIQKLIYQHEPDTLNHQLHGDAKAELLDDLLFVDARASIGKQSLSAFGQQTIDNTHLIGNQSTVKATSISPYLTHFVRGFATAELRYAHDSVRSGDFLSATTDQVLLKLIGDNGGRGWNWDAHVEQRKIDDNTIAPVTMTSGSLTLRTPLTSTIGVFSSAGYEKNDYTTNNSTQPAGRFWSVGASWNPSSRTSVVASGGKRYFGNTYSLTASYRGHNTVWNASYNEDITTTYAQFLALSNNDTSALLNRLWMNSIPDPAARQQVVDSFIRFSQLGGPNAGAVNYISHSFFLQKQLNMSMAASSPRSTLVLNFARIQNTAQNRSEINNSLLGPNQMTVEDKTRQNGVNAAWSWRLSSRSNLNLTAVANSVDSLSSERKDKNVMLSAGMSRQFRSKVTGSMDLRHVRHTSNQGGNYRENGISATLNFQF